jgi:hypothetical protein
MRTTQQQSTKLRHGQVSISSQTSPTQSKPLPSRTTHGAPSRIGRERIREFRELMEFRDYTSIAKLPKLIKFPKLKQLIPID